MADIANLGLGIDTSQVKNAKEDLKGFKTAAGDAAAGAKDLGGASQQMARALQELVAQQKQTNELLQQHGLQLSNLKVQTTSYTDTLAKWATGVALVYGAYQVLNGILQLNISIVKAVGAGAVEVSNGLDQLNRYGANAFKTMADGAVAAQKAIAAIGATVGATGGQVQNFVQTLGPLGATPGAANSAFQVLQRNLVTNGQEGQIARRTLADYGVSAEGSPEEILSKFLTALQGYQNGPQKTQAAINVLGPSGADLATDTITKLGQLTDLQKSNNTLAADNARIELQANEARRQADITRAAWYASTPLASLVAPEQQSRLGLNLTRSFQEILGRGPGGGFLNGLSDAARSVGSYVTGGQPASGTNAWYQVTQPQFASSTALDYSAKNPATFQDIAKGNADLTATGDPMTQRLQALTDLEVQLEDDLGKGAISVDQYRAAIARLNETVLFAIDPISKALSDLGKQGSLYEQPAGQARSTEQYLRQQREQYWNAQATKPTGPNGETVGPSEFYKYQIPGGAEAQLSAGFSQANVVGPQRDITAAAQRTAAGANAVAGAALNGPYEAEIANLRAQANNSAALVTDPAAKKEIYAQLAAQIDALDASYTRAANSFIFGVKQQSSALNTEAAAILAAGKNPVGPEGVLAGARASVRRMLPNIYDDNSKLDISDENVQASVLKASDNPVQSAGAMEKHLNALIQAQQNQVDQTNGPASVGSMRGQMGITQLTTELETYESTLKDAVAAGGSLTADNQARIDVIDKEISALKDLSKQLHDVQIERAKERLDKSFSKQIETYNGEAAVYKAGGTPEDVQRGLDAVKIQEQYKQVGSPITADQANALAASLEAAAKGAADAKKAFDDWQNVITGTTSTIVDSLTNLATGAERPKAALASLIKGLDQIGLKYFVTDPLKTAGQSLLEGKGFDFGTSGQGLQSWLGKMFGGTSGSNPIADALTSQPINAATVILNASSVVSGGGVGGAASGSGSWLSGLFGGSSSSDAGAGASAFDSSATADAYGAEAGLATFHFGGIVGQDGYAYPRSLSPDIFRGAQRFHSGGLLPDEVPIIAQRGERVLTKQQNEDYSRQRSGVTVNMTVHATDANSFRASQSQIYQDAAMHADRVNNRFG